MRTELVEVVPKARLPVCFLNCTLPSALESQRSTLGPVVVVGGVTGGVTGGAGLPPLLHPANTPIRNNRQIVRKFLICVEITQNISIQSPSHKTVSDSLLMRQIVLNYPLAELLTILPLCPKTRYAFGQKDKKRTEISAL